MFRASCGYSLASSQLCKIHKRNAHIQNSMGVETTDGTLQHLRFPGDHSAEY